jgi:hypothetical protein
MAHFANEHKSRVIEHHLRLLDRYVLNDETEQTHCKKCENNQEEEKKGENTNIPVTFGKITFKESN